MSIQFGHSITVNPTESKEFSSEKICQMLPFEEISRAVRTPTEGVFAHCVDPEKIRDKFIEIKPGAYTDEQMQAIMNGEFIHDGHILLSSLDYGKKWRAWDGGKPYAEQMAATEWEV